MRYRQRGGTTHHIKLWIPSTWNFLEVKVIGHESRLQLEDLILQLYPDAEIYSWSAPEDYVPEGWQCLSVTS